MLTKRMINEILHQAGIKRGGLTAAAAARHGIPYPPSHGWKKVLAAKLMHTYAKPEDDRPTPKAGRSSALPKKLAYQRPKKQKPSDEFYASWEWKAARFEAIKRHGRRCMCCGWSPEEGTPGHLVVDHIKPRSKFPALALVQDNLQVLCNACNMGKSNRHYDDFRPPAEPEEMDLSYDEEAAAFRDMLH